MATYGAAELAASFRTVRKNTIQIAEDIPEDKYTFQPAEGTRTVAGMLTHIAVATRIFQAVTESGVTTMVGFDFMTPFMANLAEEQKSRSKAEIIALLQSEGEIFAKHVESLSNAFLYESIVQPDGQSSKTRLEGLMGAKEHEMHHRAQLMLVERLLGIKPHLTRQMEERFAARQTGKQ